jgi:hypothetical protein
MINVRELFKTQIDIINDDANRVRYYQKYIDGQIAKAPQIAPILDLSDVEFMDKLRFSHADRMVGDGAAQIYGNAWGAHRGNQMLG